MRDQITRLCNRLMKTQNANEVRPVSAQLQRAIRERVEKVRENAVEVVLLDRIVDSVADGVLTREPADDSLRSRRIARPSEADEVLWRP